MSAKPLPLLPACAQQAAKVVELLLARLVMEVDPALPADFQVGGKKNSRKIPEGREETASGRAICIGQTLHEVWRVFGMRCSSCGDGCVHFVCGKASDWTCDGC